MLHRGAPFRARLPSSWPRPLLRLCAGCPSCARTAVSIATSTVAACLQAMLRCVSSFLRVSSSRRLPALHFYGPQLGAWLTLETIPRTRPMALTASSRPGRQALACSELAAITTVCDKCPFSLTVFLHIPPCASPSFSAPPPVPTYHINHAVRVPCPRHWGAGEWLPVGFT